MDTADLTERVRSLKGMSRGVLERRSSTPGRQTAMLWFGVGVAVTGVAMYFFDARQGSARRHMAYDRMMATGRDVQDWGGKKARHLRNKAMGTVAEMKGSGSGSSDIDAAVGGSR